MCSSDSTSPTGSTVSVVPRGRLEDLRACGDSCGLRFDPTFLLFDLRAETATDGPPASAISTSSPSSVGTCEGVNPDFCDPLSFRFGLDVDSG